MSAYGYSVIKCKPNVWRVRVWAANSWQMRYVFGSRVDAIAIVDKLAWMLPLESRIKHRSVVETIAKA